MKHFIALAATLGLLFGGASAQQMVSNPSGVIPSLSFQDVEPVLREAGFKTQITDVNGETVLRVNASNKTLVLYRKACSTDTSCAGLWIFAFINDSQTLETLNQFNQASKPARATLTNGKVLLDRYLIADYGTTRGSLIVNVGVLAGMVDQWFTYSKQNGPIAVSFEPILMGPTAPNAATTTHDGFDILRVLGSDASVYNSDDSHIGQTY